MIARTQFAGGIGDGFADVALELDAPAPQPEEFRFLKDTPVALGMGEDGGVALVLHHEEHVHPAGGEEVLREFDEQQGAVVGQRSMGSKLAFKLFVEHVFGGKFELEAFVPGVGQELFETFPEVVRSVFRVPRHDVRCAVGTLESHGFQPANDPEAVLQARSAVIDPPEDMRVHIHAVREEAG